ncbi:overproduction-induced pheromone-resistant [Fusarium falciforme]
MKDEDAESDKGAGGLNIDGMVGLVVGGIVMIAVATHLVWRFYIKSKRPQTPISIYVEDVNSV